MGLLVGIRFCNGIELNGLHHPYVFLKQKIESLNTYDIWVVYVHQFQVHHWSIYMSRGDIWPACYSIYSYGYKRIANDRP
jgi:hypothetical protein